MQHAYYLDFLWNYHDWYHIENVNDFVRAVLWCVANIVTAFCYFVIPYEIWLWRRELASTAAIITGFGFIFFIALCGMHHVVDVIIMQTAPWWAVLMVNVPMALASLATAYFIVTNRQLIIDVLRLLNGNAVKELDTLSARLDKIKWYR
jgi:hypothetical protein